MNKDSTQNATANKQAVIQDLSITDSWSINAKHWNAFTVILLVMSTFWHLKNVAGWLNGNTLVQVYGMDELLSAAIAACPDILFYTTYYTMALSVGLLIFTLVMFVLFMFDRKDSNDVLGPVMLGTIISVWAFPLLHAIIDLIATAFDIRSSIDFDVFQLGIDILPLLVITIVCFVVMQLSKRIHI